MQIPANDLDTEYRNRLYEHCQVLIALESGGQIDTDRVMLALVFLQAHLSHVTEYVSVPF